MGSLLRLIRIADSVIGSSRIESDAVVDTDFAGATAWSR